MSALAMPSREEAEHHVRDVGYLDGARGFDMSPTAGHTPWRLTSLPMVYEFLHPVEDVDPENRKASVHFINPTGLAGWVRETVGDTELGDALDAIASDGRPYGQQVHDLKRTIGERLEQYGFALRAAAG